MGAYNPVSYHNGSVWPHDNALIVSGLMRYGFVDEAHGSRGHSWMPPDAFGGRLPELFCGFDRGEYPVPVPYPTSAPRRRGQPRRRSSSSVPCYDSTHGFRREALGGAILPWASHRCASRGSPGRAKVTLAVSAQGTSLETGPAGVQVRPEPQPLDCDRP